MDLVITDLESAINYWRAQRPSRGEERALSPEVNALADVYARMIFSRAARIPEVELDESVRALLAAWREQAPRS